MISPSEIHGKRMAMIAWGTMANGEDDVVVFTGLADWDGAVLAIRRTPAESSFVVPAEWLSRIELVPADLKSTLLDADYQFSVTVGDIGDEDSALYLATGLKWPQEGAE